MAALTHHLNQYDHRCSLGQPEKVQVSERTALMIEQEFVTRPHPSGAIAVKGKGMMQTYFVESKRESTPSRRVEQVTCNHTTRHQLDLPSDML